MDAAGTSVPRTQARDCLAIVAVAAAFALIVRPLQGTPFVDDWVYAWSVEHLLTRGRLLVLDLSSNMNVAQTLWGALFARAFGFSFTVLDLSTWVLATAGLCALYLLLRELDVPRREALIGTATLGVYPVFAILGATFMTDIPFLSLTIAASAAFARAVRVRETRWLVAAAAIGSLAMGTRMVAVVAPIAMCLALVASQDPWGRRRGRWAVTLMPLAAFAALAFWYPSHVFHVADVTWVATSPVWRLNMLRFIVPCLPEMAPSAFMLATGAVGLGLLPLAAGCIGRGTIGRTIVIAAVLAIAIVAARSPAGGYVLPLATGETWALNELGGSAALVPGYRGPYVADLACGIAMALAVGSLAASVAAMRRLARSAVDLFLFLAILGHVAAIAALWLIHDHYALVLLPFAIAVILRARPSLDWRPAVAVLVLMGSVSAVGASDERRFNHAVWQAIDALHRAGGTDAEINGGYTVNGWLQWAHPDRAPRDANGHVVVADVNGASAGRYTVTNTPAAGSRQIGAFSVAGLIGPSGTLYAIEKPSP